MSALKFYQYASCSTCKKALKFLETHRISYVAIPIVERPLTKVELKAMLQYLKDQGESVKKLFNTSGLLYKEMKLSEKISSMSESEAIDLLSQHGKLIKRPFVLGKDFGLLGFKEEQWKQVSYNIAP